MSVLLHKTALVNFPMATTVFVSVAHQEMTLFASIAVLKVPIAIPILATKYLFDPLPTY